MRNENILLIDGHNYLFRAFGMPFRFHTKKGTPLHVLTVYLKYLRQALSIAEKSSKCSHIAVVFDAESKKSDNYKLLAEYKANRPKIEPNEHGETPFTHLPVVKEALEMLGITYIEIPEFEADDIVATLATKYTQTNRQSRAHIASNDSDFYQLLGSNVKQILSKRGGKSLLVDHRYVEEELGVTTSQYVMYKSLVGDSSDNIKGIPKIGKVTAAKILNGEKEFDFDSHRETLDLNQKLIGLNTDAEISVDVGDLGFDRKVMELSNPEIFRKCGF